MESHTDLAVKSGALQKPFSIRRFDSHEVLNKTEHPSEAGVPGYRVLKAALDLPPGFPDTLRLDGYAEAVYDVPRDTSLLKVLGPVGQGPFSCYFSVRPDPGWYGELPKFWADQAEVTNQTLFVFPLDPDIKHELAMGSVESRSSATVDGGGYDNCQFNGVTAYSYYWYEAMRPTLTVGKTLLNPHRRTRPARLLTRRSHLLGLSWAG